MIPAASASYLRYTWVSQDVPAPVAVPTPMPKLAPGEGGVVVDNFCGFDVTITVGGKLSVVPQGGRVVLTLPAGKYSVRQCARATPYLWRWRVRLDRGRRTVHCLSLLRSLNEQDTR